MGRRGCKEGHLQKEGRAILWIVLPFLFVSSYDEETGLRTPVIVSNATVKESRKSKGRLD